MSSILDSSKDDIQFATAFNSVLASDLSPSPFLKIRTLAILRERRAQTQKIRFWQSLTALSLTSLFFICFIVFKNASSFKPDGLMNQSYVIQVDLNQDDLQRVTHAEVTLPNDVHFVSNEKGIRSQKSLKLPVLLKTVGRSRLPFIVRSDSVGEKEICVKLLDENNQFVRENILKFKFAKDDNKIAF